MLAVAPGEIVTTDLRPIEPEKALWLGAHLLERAKDLERQREHELGGYRIRIRAEESDDSFGLSLRVNPEASQLLYAMVESYANSLSSTEQAFDTYDQWLILSMNGGIIPWHTDTPGDARFMHNLGDRTHVDVATQWNPKDYWTGEPDELSIPISFEPLILELNQSYVSNNLVTNTDVMRPHQTPTELTRIVLRTSLFAADGWEQAAIGDGVTLRLV